MEWRCLGVTAVVSAFGLSVSSEFPLIGVPAGSRASAPQTVVRRVSAGELDTLRCAHDRVLGQAGPDADGAVRVGWDAELGYLLDLPDAGLFSVSGDGGVVRCAPLGLEGWRWQRGLFAGPLPFAALARGIEVFHASAVVLGGRLIAMTGPSGSGKTSLAAFLRLRGARFFTDDVLALEARGEVVAHPGPPLLNLRQSTARLLSAAERARLGSVLGTDRTQVRIATETCQGPRPVAALYYLERRADADSLTFEPVNPSSRLLLAASYNFVIRSPERRLRQLDVCSRLAKATPVTRIVVPPSVDARGLAAAVAEHAIHRPRGARP